MEILSDHKLKADTIPIFTVGEINAKYKKEKQPPDFDLKRIVRFNFEFLQPIVAFQEKRLLPVDDHINKLCDKLTRTAYEDRVALLKLSGPYLILKAALGKNIVKNGTCLIQAFSFVPNAAVPIS